MKLYHPLFSGVIIVIQFVLSLKEHLNLMDAKAANPELFELININVAYKTLFLSVLAIGIYEMLTKPGWLKTLLRVLLVGIVLGSCFADHVPINNFYFGVYHAARVLAIVAFVLTIVKFFRVQTRKNDHQELT